MMGLCHGHLAKNNIYVSMYRGMSFVFLEWKSLCVAHVTLIRTLGYFVDSFAIICCTERSGGDSITQPARFNVGGN